jgi:hypothetical protein
MAMALTTMLARDGLRPLDQPLQLLAG